jgi:RNA polymerase sigma-70 factor (ECF subfamily)
MERVVDAAESRFDALYRAHAESIRSYCLRRLGPDDAGDAAADVFTVVWRRLGSCPPDGEARLWIYGIARNVVANRRRGAHRSQSLIRRAAAEGVTAAANPERIVVRKSEYEELDAALARLPSRYREVLILAEWDGLDRETIAQLEGVTRSAIDQRISRAYKRLARSMKSQSARSKARVVPNGVKEGGGA